MILGRRPLTSSKFNSGSGKTIILILTILLFQGCGQDYKFDTRSLPQINPQQAAETNNNPNGESTTISPGPKVGPTSAPAPLSTIRPSPTTTAVPTASPMPSSSPQLGNIHGMVVDASTKTPLSNVSVALKDTTGKVVVQSTNTNSSGAYQFNGLQPKSYNLTFIKDNYITYTAILPLSVSEGQTTFYDVAMSRELFVGQLRVVLTWAGPPPGWPQNRKTYQDHVMDMDSYLLVPGFTKPVFYGHCNDRPYGSTSVNCNQAMEARLDRDDVHWKGPETVTIYTQFAGNYTYYIANYSAHCNPLALANSKAEVTVYAGTGIVKQISITPTFLPGSKSGRAFEVFRLNGATITPVLQYSDSLPYYIGPSNSCDQLDNYGF